jgi:hypothetical protein
VIDMSIYQVRASTSASEPQSTTAVSAPAPELTADELTILSSWTEAAAEALTYSPERVSALEADGRARASWREPLGLADVRSGADGRRGKRDTGRRGPLAIRDAHPDEPGLERLVGRVLRSALEQRQTRQAGEAAQR